VKLLVIAEVAVEFVGFDPSLEHRQQVEHQAALAVHTALTELSLRVVQEWHVRDVRAGWAAEER
jgi:hypothetical protein